LTRLSAIEITTLLGIPTADIVLDTPHRGRDPFRARKISPYIRMGYEPRRGIALDAEHDASSPLVYASYADRHFWMTGDCSRREGRHLVQPSA
jgi:hypothetical protein